MPGSGGGAARREDPPGAPGAVLGAARPAHADGVPPATPPLVVADSAASVSYAAPAVPAPRAFLTREVAPGVLVTLDPRLVPDPETVLARIERAVHLVPPGGSR